MTVPGETALLPKGGRRPSGAVRLLQVVLIWGLIVGIMVGVACVIGGVLRDSVPLIDQQLAQMRSSTSVAYASPDDVRNNATGGTDLPRPYVVDGHTITNPAWVAVPSPVYPFSAMDGMQSGRVALACEVAATGRLDACQITEEEPTGQGFGAAALEATRAARLAPRTVDGIPVGGKIRFTMRFSPGR